MNELWQTAVAGVPVWVACIMLAMQLLAPAFHFHQNRDPNRLGGPISRAKAAWLIFAINLWLVFPLLMATQHAVYAWLGASMLLRAVIELPLCASKRWSTNHGLAHDAIHMVLALCWLPYAPVEARLWIVLTLITLTAEVFFVLSFRKRTAGPANGVFFVPDGPAHGGLNLLTDLIRMPCQYLMISILIAACFT